MKRTTARAVALLFACATLQAYSVLSHEAIIDTAWDTHLRPLLLKRFPQATPDELRNAHANAYAGCIIQDMGYYPFGSHTFSDLVHYVRSGDFILNLLKEARTLEEYAFALGALAHYAADTRGHSIAVNRAVPIQYPKLAKEYGPVVTYAQNPTDHLRVEFSFDVLQVARGSYAPQQYHDFIGFDVPADVLDRAFYDTYSIKLGDVFTDLDLALGTYRHTVSSLVPKMTRAAWDLKKDDLQRVKPSLTRRAFVYNLSRASYRKQWDNKYKAPGVGSKILAFLIWILPKVGPLRALAFQAPSAQTESLFELSFDRTLTDYRRFLTEQGEGRLRLENRDFDTGALTRPGEYSLADRTYAWLARTLAAQEHPANNPELIRNVLDFFAGPDPPPEAEKNRKEWRKTVHALEKLRNAAAANSE
ncbi:MAG TPA: zinc dependent phospholipase C family protein [Candidatus Acidoferrales bacterium]|nr:zinc dependent phospholipase C family protein [Candidatus Acidoferrales bacterium]